MINLQTRSWKNLRPDEVLQEEKDLSDWECNCTKKPKNCKCKQAQVLLHGEKASLNEDFLKYQKHRNGLKRALRIEAHEEAEEMKTMVQAEKAKISGIQAAIKAIKKSKGPKAKTPISISGCVYDLHCIELYQLLEDAEGCEGNEIAFFEDWETEEGTDEFDPPLPPPYTRSSGPSRYTPGTDLFAFVTLNEVVYGESAWCSNEFSGPKHAGRYIISTYGTRKSEGETMEITFHNNDYLELKVYVKTVLGFCDGHKSEAETFSNYFKKIKDQKNQCFHFYGVRRKDGLSDEESEEESEEESDEGSDEGSEEGSEEYEEGFEEDSEEDSEQGSEEGSYPPWFYRVCRHEDERVGTKREYDALPGWIFDEDLSDWECDCNKDPADCKCWQPSPMLTGDDEMDEEFRDAHEDRNKRKRDLRIKRFKKEKAKAEGPKRNPTWLFLEHQIAKASQIQAAIRDIENSKATGTKTPINIIYREYDLYCPELCRLVNREGVFMNESLYFVTTFWVNRDDRRSLSSHYYFRQNDYWCDKPPEYIERDVCTFMSLGQLRSKRYYSKPFLNPRYAGRYSVGDRWLEDADVEITFHNQDYLELKLYANMIRRNFGYGDPGLEERLADYFQLDTPYLRWYGVLRTPERDIALIEEECHLKEKYMASNPPLQAFR
ncbi:hypothetical protein K4K48_007368 [Colletotrichum sp. SAR 10_66]|nr:hypothetical protein K4K48_007368 [Colletotrichum sp. SAR 10_66]